MTTLAQKLEHVLHHKNNDAVKNRSIQPQKSGIDVSSLSAYNVVNTHGFKVRTWCGGDGKFFWGLASSQGRRPNMEDAHSVHLSLDNRTALFGVFDGHAGKEVAAYCANHIREVVLNSAAYKSGQLEGALSEAFLTLEQQMKRPEAKRELFCLRNDVSTEALGVKPEVANDAKDYGITDGTSGQYLGPQAGATACVALIRDDQLYVASVGDSRCVLADNGKAVALTRDHKAVDAEEARRVVKAGLSIEHNRVRAKNSTLAMTRTLGDMKYKQPELPPQKQAVTPVPDTTTVGLDVNGGAAAGTPAVNELGVADFLVLACDGLWDCMSNQQAVTFLHVAMDKGLSPQAAALALVDEVLAPTATARPTMDNVTVLVVQFAPMPDVAA